MTEVEVVYFEEEGSWSAEIPSLRWTGVGCATRGEARELAREGAAYVLGGDPSEVSLVERAGV